MYEYMVERIVSHRKDGFGIRYLRVRWFGHGPEADTIEPLLHVPHELPRRYAKTKKVNPTKCMISRNVTSASQEIGSLGQGRLRRWQVWEPILLCLMLEVEAETPP
jgi:hypothetical protein